MNILEEYLSNARMKLGQLEEQRAAWIQKKDSELAREKEKLARRTGGPSINFELIKAEVEKEKTRFDSRIESVKAEIAQLEEQINSEDYQLLNRAQAELEPVGHRARQDWPGWDRGNEREFLAQWIQLQKDALREKMLEAIKEGSGLEAIRQRVQLYWLGLGGTEAEFKVEWDQIAKDAFRERTLEAIKQGIDPIFSK